MLRLAELERRFAVGRRKLFARRLTIESGGIADYALLAEHHYRAGRPATATRVWRAVWMGLSDGEIADPDFGELASTELVEVNRAEGIGLGRRVVGVLVESMPMLRCRQRDAAMGGRYASIGCARQRAKLINAELRCISRVVVHPQFRGLGLAVRLVRHALATATTPLTEALAAMGRVHPFFEKAGMTAYPRPAHACDARLADAMASIGVDRATLMRPDAARQTIGQLPDLRQRWIERELRRWRQHTDRGKAKDGDDVAANLHAARQRLFCEPVYYVHARAEDLPQRTQREQTECGI
jgi:GNAT superfamily N-acetyltransferase